MRPRFLVAASPDVAIIDAVHGRVIRELPGGTVVRTAASDGQLLVMTSGGSPIALRERGYLIGSVFKRGSSGPLSVLNEAEQYAVITTRGAWLINACWGGYVAVIANPTGSVMDVMRAPLGDLACHVVHSAEGLICASDLSLLTASGLLRPSIDADALARHLAADDIRRTETCLSGVSELPGGERITFDRGCVGRQTMWSPWLFAEHDRQIADPWAIGEGGMSHSAFSAWQSS